MNITQNVFVKIRGIGCNYGIEHIATLLGIQYGIVWVAFKIANDMTEITQFSTFDGTQIPYNYNGFQLDMDSILFTKDFREKVPLHRYHSKVIKYDDSSFPLGNAIHFDKSTLKKEEKDDDNVWSALG